MAPDIAKIDSDRKLKLGLSVGNFSNGVMQGLFHDEQSLPFGKACSSHFVVKWLI